MSAPNWLGLLRWTIAHTDGTNESKFAEMKEEDKVWLERVMKEVVRDDPQRMNEIMISIKDIFVRLEEGAILSDDEFETMETDLEDLRDIVEQVDMAQVFAKFHGATILLQVANCLKFPPELRALALGVIATVAQNNIVTQDLFYQQKLCQELVKTFVSTDNFLVATKGLLAISAITRGHAAAEELFVQEFSHVVIPRALNSQYANLVNRLLFFCNALICSDHASLGRIAKLVPLLLPGVIEYIMSEISIDVRDNLMTLLYSLLHTEAAWTAMNRPATITAPSIEGETTVPVSSSHKEALLQALAEREQSLHGVNEEDLSAEDKVLEVSKIQGLRLALDELSVIYPVSLQQRQPYRASGGGGDASGDTQQAVEEETDQPQPILLIAPPEPVAAPHIP